MEKFVGLNVFILINPNLRLQEDNFSWQHFKKVSRTLICLLSFLCLLLTHVFFPVQSQTEMAKNSWSKSLCCQLYFFWNNHFLHVFSVFLSLDYLINSLNKKSNSVSLSGTSEIRTHNHLVCQQTLNHCIVSTYLYSAFDCMLLSCHTSFRANQLSIVRLNVKELLSRSRSHIWSLSDSNEIRTYNKASFAKWLSVRLRTKWLWVRILLLSLKLQIWHLLLARSSLTFRQTIEWGFTLKLKRDMIITYSKKFLIIFKTYVHYLDHRFIN